MTSAEGQDARARAGRRTSGSTPGGPGAGTAVAVDREGLADELGDLARSLQEQEDTQQTLQAIVHGAVDTVEGAEHASISVVVGRQEVRTPAATGEFAVLVDQVQYDTGQGPCLDTLYEQQTVSLHDIALETRWPRFRARAALLGLRSMLSVQLFVQGDDLGALNLHSGRPDAFDEESEHVALLFAVHAAVALAGSKQVDRLVQALGTRDLIGQAKGILMERFKLTGDQAFALLVRHSQSRNRKLRDVAEDLVTSGRLPGT